MKILHLFNEIRYSGAEIMYANAASLFQKEGVELIAFSTGTSLGNYAPIFELQKIKVYHRQINFSPLSIKGVTYYMNFYRFLKEEKVDVLHVHRNSLFFVAFIAMLANVKTVKTMHSVFINRKFTRPYAIFRRWFVRTLCNTTFHSIGKSVYNNELKYYKNPSVLISNWFDDNKFYPAKDLSDRIEKRAELGISPNDFVIISAGSCSHIKRHDEIIRALAIVNKQIKCIYIHLGEGENEACEKNLAGELAVSDLVRFCGNRINVRDYLVAADVFVMTSKYEGLSIASIEAMGCGLPLILYDVVGLRDLIENDDNGFLIEQDYNCLADSIIYFYNHKDIMEVKGQKALQFATTCLSKKKKVSEIIALYKD